MTHLHTEITKRVHEAVAEVNRIYGARRGPMPTPKVSFFPKGLTAGRANYRRHEVSFNEAHLAEFTEDMLEDTAPHEVAHLAAWYFFREGGHGPAWAGIMMALGRDPNRCYKYDARHLAARKVERPFVYECGCRQHKITLNKHSKMMRGITYTCNRCGNRLKFVKNDGQRISLAELAIAAQRGKS